MGAETERGHCTTGEGMMSCVCVTERNVKDEEEIKEGRYLGMMELERRRVCV